MPNNNSIKLNTAIKLILKICIAGEITIIQFFKLRLDVSSFLATFGTSKEPF